MRDFDDNEFPLAYLITFRCYGTWLHGDERGSYRRSAERRPVRVPPRPRLVTAETEQLKHLPVQLNNSQRKIVEDAIREVCLHRRYTLYAVNARTNHVHSVVTAPCKPEHVMDSFKAYATRRLRESGLFSRDIKPWARHGSTPYLWTEEEVERAIDYVINGQGEEPFR